MNNLLPLELLAPAKNLECGIAAIDHGADAVYIGALQFGARAAAGNSIDDIRQLCRYAHQYAAKVYVTVNTLLHPHELPIAAQLIQQVWEAGADAVLVQDLALLQMPLPPIALHASTQTDNRTAQRVRQFLDLGFHRVVLARELSVDEIAAIHREVPDMPLEVFVHGALCVGYSGLCYASEHCFGRSANRGQCAQFCRMPFDLLDADGNELEHQRYLLSLKDLNQSTHLDELIEAGATSFKIEGRLKDIFYVKNVVAAYSHLLDAYISRHADRYCRASKGRCIYTFIPDLRKTFNRGYTTYFLHGRQPDIYSPDTPKAIGQYVGTVKSLQHHSLTVAGTSSFANGDGLCYINKVRALEGFRVNRVEGNRLFVQQLPASLRVGMALYRNNDQQFERLLSRPSAVRKIPISLHLSATADGVRLSANGVTVSVACECQTAQKPPHDNIRRQLSKLGDTVYECTELTFAPDFNYFIPNSVLSLLRRQLVEALSQDDADHGNGSANPPSPSDCDSRENQPRHPAEENRPHDLLMQCRHCLRYAFGYCVRHGGKHPAWREPLFLRLGDGRRFRLEFDCKNCQMNVYEAR